jgi:predicted aspartyl protease
VIKLWLFLPALFGLCESGQVYAQACSAEQVAVLPITYSTFLPTVPALINGHQVQIAVDTGAEKSTLTPEILSKVKLPYANQHMTGFRSSGGDTLFAPNVLVDLEFAGRHYDQQVMPLVSSPLFISSNLIEVFRHENPNVGIIGTDILADYDLQFDFPQKTLTLYRVGKCEDFNPPWQGHYATLPIKITARRRILVPTEVEGHAMNALFDTGSAGEGISLDAADGLGISADDLAKDQLGSGSGIGETSFKTPIHVFSSVQIGDEIFKNRRYQFIRIKDSQSDMLIGEDYMLYRRFWISYATSKLFIQVPK